MARRRGGNEAANVTTADDRPGQTLDGETTPRPLASAPESTTASPGATLAIVRQSSETLG